MIDDKGETTKHSSSPSYTHIIPSQQGCLLYSLETKKLKHCGNCSDLSEVCTSEYSTVQMLSTASLSQYSTVPGNVNNTPSPATAVKQRTKMPTSVDLNKRPLSSDVLVDTRASKMVHTSDDFPNKYVSDLTLQLCSFVHAHFAHVYILIFGLDTFANVG